tara:strand:- start:833 stop:1201 length:369 start_codon:yes stop_codon:yes gene_type:complete
MGVEKILKDTRRVVVDSKSVMVTQVYKSRKLQEKLIVENPESAKRLYASDENRFLGRSLVRVYKGNKVYDPEIAEIAKKFHVEYLPEPLNPVKQAALDAENDKFLEKVGRVQFGERVRSGVH